MRNLDGAIEFAASERFDVRHTTLVAWGKGDVVWVYSGDVGVFFWVRGMDGAWRKALFQVGSQAEGLPDVFVRLRPEFFGQGQVDGRSKDVRP